MGSFLYKPDCPMSNKNGFVPKEDWHIYLSLTKEDKWMTKGNQRVSFGYIADEIASTRHMANGKYYTSKKKFRQATKAAGCIEVGDQTSYVTKPKKFIAPDRRQRRDDIKRAIYELKNKK